jgi:hypothetical protein
MGSTSPLAFCQKIAERKGSGQFSGQFSGQVSDRIRQDTAEYGPGLRARTRQPEAQLRGMRANFVASTPPAKAQALLHGVRASAIVIFLPPSGAARL